MQGMLINIMLGRGKGGIEQAALDYAEACNSAGMHCLTIIQPGAAIGAQLAAKNLPHRTLHALSGYDVIAALRLRRLCRSLPVANILTHGNRALSIAKLANMSFQACDRTPHPVVRKPAWCLNAFRFANSKTKAKIIAVAHNYKIKRFASGIDAAFAPTEHLANAIRAINPLLHVAVVPNITHISPTTARPAWRTPPTIGTLARFVPEKSLDVLIDALALLRARGIDFRARIGGDGPEKGALEARIAQHYLSAHVTLSGWVSSKESFLQQLDIFTLPSTRESFGIALLEAMAAGLPCIATTTPGPSSILSITEASPHPRGTLVPIGNPEALANALSDYIATPTTATAHGQQAQAHVAAHFTPEALSKRLTSALRMLP